MIIKVFIIILESYDDALDFLDKIKDFAKKYELAFEYGQKFLTETPVKMMKFLKNFINQIIILKKNGNDPQIKYENLIKIFLNQENLLEELLDFIINTDENCDQAIIHR